MSDYISRADAIEAVKSTKPIVRSTDRNWGKMIAEQHSKELVKALKALPSADAEKPCKTCGYYNLECPKDCEYNRPSAEPIERISDNTIVVKYADYEDIGRIILTNGDIFCKMFYEDARQNDDSDYDSLVPDEYKTEPSEQVTSKLKNPCDSLLTEDKDDSKEQKSKLDLISRADVLKYPIRLDHYDEVNGSREFVYGVESVIEYVESLPSADAKGDLISRRWLLDLYGDYIGDNGEPKYHVPLEVVRQNILDAPSADAYKEWLGEDMGGGDDE